MYTVLGHNVNIFKVEIDAHKMSFGSKMLFEQLIQIATASDTSIYTLIAGIDRFFLRFVVVLLKRAIHLFVTVSLIPKYDEYRFKSFE